MWERFSDENPPRWRALRTRIRIESTQALPVVWRLQQLLKASATGVDQEHTLKTVAFDRRIPLVMDIICCT
jgi:hypothetical protein